MNKQSKDEPKIRNKNKSKKPKKSDLHCNEMLDEYIQSEDNKWSIDKIPSYIINKKY
jgi:hypothetical protein